MGTPERAEVPSPESGATEASSTFALIDARYRVALANSGVVVFEQDAELRYTWIGNTQFYEMKDVVGRTDDELFPAADAASLVELKRRVLRTGERAREQVSVTMGGRRYVYLLTVDPVRDGQGNVVGLTGASRDVTAAKETEEGLARALQFRDEVIGILGHDLRNPLGAIYGGARHLLQRGLIAPGGEPTLRIMERSAERMLNMIATLLDFAEGQLQSELPVSPRPTDLSEVVRRVADEIEASDSGRKIQVMVEGDVRGVWDADRLAQVASNLMVNAVKHGARAGEVNVEVRGEDESVVLEVHNDGAPIPAERLARLFQPFQRGRAADASAHRGLGLGLYIARQIVRAHAGTIDVDSAPDRGTTFRVNLPRRR